MTRDIVRAHHCATGHIGAKRLIIEMDKKFPRGDLFGGCANHVRVLNLVQATA